MNAILFFFRANRKTLYIAGLLLCLFPFVSPPIALFTGFFFALTAGEAFPHFNKKASQWMLQGSVVGLGFGMNLHQSLASGRDGMMFTIVSVISVMTLGIVLAKWMKVDQKTGYLISAGTAICGGSAIAATGPVIKAESSQMSVALGTIFILNAIALFLFPVLGHLLNMNQHQFGLWSAIAIHDTSSVVGAASAYGKEALEIATTVKLTRALWIIPLTFVTTLIFKNKSGKVYLPWFIFLYILAMTINTFFPFPAPLTTSLVWLARKGLTLSLFFIGASLSRAVLREVGIKPMIQGVLLWLFIGGGSLAYILLTTN
jgi:uncharacterized integral membrane protein (TIGR00698 family)